MKSKVSGYNLLIRLSPWRVINCPIGNPEGHSNVHRCFGWHQYLCVIRSMSFSRNPMWVRLWVCACGFMHFCWMWIFVIYNVNANGNFDLNQPWYGLVMVIVSTLFQVYLVMFNAERYFLLDKLFKT